MAAVILFDLNETLLDTGALDPHFARLFGAPEVRREWFDQLVQLALTSVITDSYTDFTRLARAALQMTAAKRGRVLSAADRAAVMDGLKSLPPYPDVADSLARLRDAGLRVAALTNGTLSSARQQLRHAGLWKHFEAVFSADEVRRLKPARPPYHMAAERLGVPPSAVRLVAAHAWDLAGASAAGLKTAFVARPHKTLNPAAPKPDLAGRDLHDLTRRILRTDAAEG